MDSEREDGREGGREGGERERRGGERERETGVRHWGESENALSCSQETSSWRLLSPKIRGAGT